MARRELVDGYVSGRITQKDFIARLMLAGVSLSAAVAFALSLAGTAPAASTARLQSAGVFAFCAQSSFYSSPSTRITSCPDFFSAVQTATFSFFSPGTAGVRFQYNLDSATDGGGLIWRSATAPLTFRGLASGFHQVSVRGVGAGGATGDPASYSWYVPGPVAVVDTAVVSTPANNRLQATWHSDYPAWRYYCSINGGADFVCRPAGLTLNGLPGGFVSVQIRALAGPGELAPGLGRRTTISWSTGSPAPVTPDVVSDNPWGFSFK